MRPISTMDGGRQFYQPNLAMEIVFIGLFLSTFVQSEVTKSTDPEASLASKDPKKLIEAILEYTHDALNLTMKSIHIVNKTEIMVKEMENDTMKEIRLKFIDTAKNVAEQAKIDAAKGFKSAKEAYNKVKNIPPVGGNSSEIIAEALSKALHSANESRRALKESKFLALFIIEDILAQIFGTRRPKGPFRELESVQREEEITMRGLFDIDAIMKKIQTSVKQAFSKVMAEITG